MAMFDDLKASLEEALDIQQGENLDGRITRHEIPDIKALRAQLNVSQLEFAKAMGTSVDTIKSWESRRRNPTGLAAKVLTAIQAKPEFYRELEVR